MSLPGSSDPGRVLGRPMGWTKRDRATESIEHANRVTRIERRHKPGDDPDFDFLLTRLHEANAEVERLRANVERLENILADCRKHRDRAETSERRLLDVYAQLADLLSDEHGE